MNIIKHIPDNFFYVLLFVCVSLISGHYLLSYDYHMDDAWVMAGNYVHGSIFSSEGLDNLLQNIAIGYKEQWEGQGRFPGALPIIRGIEGIFITEVEEHYFLNLLFHGVNSFFLYKILKNILKVDKNVALISGLFFACCFAIDTSLYALTLFIGSGYVNYLSLFFAIILVTPNYAKNKRVLYALHVVYFMLALGNYSFVVVAPSVALFTYISTHNPTHAIKHFLFLVLPIALNLLIRTYAPETSYVGTTPKLELAHVFNNLSQLFSFLMPENNFLRITVVGFIVISMIQGFKIKKVSLIPLICILGLLTGYLFLYAISARDNFENPYFVYIPYSGLLLLIGYLINVWTNRILLSYVLFITLMFFQYEEGKEYRLLRETSSIAIGNFKDEFREIEKSTFDPRSSLVIVLFDNFSYGKEKLGYFDRTINSWRSMKNQATYVIATNYLTHGALTKFYVGVNQYSQTYRGYLSVDEIIYRLTQRQDKAKRYEDVRVIRVKDDNSFEHIKIDYLEKKNILYKSAYQIERYGNDKRYYWTDGGFDFQVFQSGKDLGKKAILQFTIASLFNDELDINIKDEKVHLALDKNTPVRSCIGWTIDGLTEKINIRSEKRIKPSGDSRYLSFRIDEDAEFRVLGNEFHVDMDLGGYASEGFYDNEETHRWTSPNATIYFDKCLKLTGNLIIELLGSFESKNLPQAIINGSLRPTRITRKSKGALQYEFKAIESPLESLSFKVNGFKAGNGDPRELGFMFHSLHVELVNDL